jgi:hypothetical protein
VVLGRKTERLARERELLIKSRIQIVEPLYKSYLKSLKPSQLLFQPCLTQVCEFTKFNDVVQAADDINVDAASFTEAMEMLPGLIIAWTEERRKMLLDLISTSSKETADITLSGISSRRLVPPTVAPVQGLPSACPPAATVDPLSLATSVFKCGRACAKNDSPWGNMIANCLIAWEGVNTHQCSWYAPRYSMLGMEAVPSIYKFSTSGSAVAAALISAVGLKADRATPTDMDRLGPLFFCQTCGPQNHPRNVSGCDVYTWRSAVCRSFIVNCV